MIEGELAQWRAEIVVKPMGNSVVRDLEVVAGEMNGDGHADLLAVHLDLLRRVDAEPDRVATDAEHISIWETPLPAGPRATPACRRP